jgi:hypothetical protein
MASPNINFAVTNLALLLDFMTPVVRSKRKAFAVYRDLSNACDPTTITCF